MKNKKNPFFVEFIVFLTTITIIFTIIFISLKVYSCDAKLFKIKDLEKYYNLHGEFLDISNKDFVSYKIDFISSCTNI